jgi:Protein of unknown function (DUF3631)/Bifunctional DNA primase/polymerase, N-terminal
MSSQYKNRDVALRYARAGFKIFPCGTDKRPLVPSWATEATADPKQIQTWWAVHPDALIGLPMKPHDLLTFDADRHQDNEDGVAHFHALCAEREPLPAHPIVLTANGGEHHIFRQPSEKIGNRKLGNGLETRGYKDDNEGGYIIAAGSRLPDGRGWRRRDGTPSLIGTTLAKPPQWLAEYAQEKPHEETCQPEPRRSTKREESYAAKALDNLAHDLAAMAPETGRNDKLNIAALKMGGMAGAGWIGEATITGRLFDACVANGLVKDTGSNAVNATIRSGLEAGLKQPHPDLKERDRPKGNGAAPPWEEEKVAELAGLPRFEYDLRRKQEAKKLGVTLAALDHEVAERRTQQKPARNFLPHWEVQPWAEKVDGVALLDALRHQFTRYVVLPAHADVVLALWVAHTWVFECFDITPYLSITSPTKRCGKTVLMTLLYWLSCRGKKTDSMSKAAIYRSVDGEKPTLVLDEVGWVLDPKDERQGILCGGFERNGYVEVCEGEGAAIATRLFSTYCPKAFGLIGKLTPTLTDRSVVIPMRRKLRTERVERLRRRDNEEHSRLRQQCLRWAADNADALAKVPPAVFDKINDRANDFWEPLFTIAAAAGGDWPKAAQEAALGLSGDGEDDSTNILLLQDVHWLYDGKPETQDDGSVRREYEPTDRLFGRTIIEELNKISTSPWAGWNHGKGITQHNLARILKEFGAISDTVRIGSVTAKGYYRAALREAFETYLPSASQISVRPDSDFQTVTTSQTNNDGHNLQKNIRNNESLVTDEKSEETPVESALLRCDVSKTRNGGKEEKKSPLRGKGWVQVGDKPQGQAGARVWLKEKWPPPISAGRDDDVFDILDPGWRQ